MALAAEVKTLDEVPEPLRVAYVERDGKFVLDVSGMKLETEFDTYKEALQKRFAEEAERLKAANEGKTLSRTEINALVAEAAKQWGKGNGDGNGDGDRDDPRIADLERELKAATDGKAESDAKAKEADAARLAMTRDTALIGALAASGPRPEQQSNLQKLLGDQLEVASDGSVKTRLECEFGADLTPAALVAKIKTDPRYALFWPSSAGGGAGAGDGGAGPGGDANPWAAATWNRTLQTQIWREDQEKAKRLAGHAGVDVHATRKQAEAAAKKRG